MAPAPAVEGETQLVVFRLDAQRYALELNQVDHVVRRVELAPFPKAPEIICGVFNLHGELIPVADIRRRFGLPARAPRLTDQFLVVQARRRRLALIVDEVEAVAPVRTSDLLAADRLVPGLEYVRGIARLDTGIVFVQDLDLFLSVEEEELLNQWAGERA